VRNEMNVCHWLNLLIIIVIKKASKWLLLRHCMGGDVEHH